MYLQTRKLKAIEFLIRLRDEKTFSKIESAIVEVKKQKTFPQEFKPLTVEQLVYRANRSSNDYLLGNFKTQEQPEK